jgi:hypothetical protein
MLKTILIATPLAVALLGFVIAIQPAAFRITRSAKLSASPAELFAQVNDFQRWRAWSPWEGLDPALKRHYSGNSTGPGAVYSWAGNGQVGEGRMTILESRPNDFIRIRLEFLKPLAATHTAEFDFKPEGDQTVVTWRMFGERKFLAKAFGLVMNFDTLLGEQFERGLKRLQSAVEAVHQ